MPRPDHHMTLLGSAVLYLGIGVTSLATAADADDWRQFRGPNCSGVSQSDLPLPTHFSATENVVWTHELGDGVASAVIADGRCYCTGLLGDTETEGTFVVYCFDAATGKPQWQREFPTGDLPRITRPNSHASSTPATDGERVYVYFSTLGLKALDCQTGKDVWEDAIEPPNFLLGWGAAASPVLVDDVVIFAQDDDLNPFIAAYEAKTGSVRWRKERPDMLGGYAAPVLCTADGRTDIVLAGSGKLKGYRPSDGKELWNCNTMLRTVMTSPVVVDDSIFISIQSYGDTDRHLKPALLQWKDTDQDGKLSREEVPKPFWKKFDKGDKNKDQFLVDTEIDAAFQSPDNMVGGGQTIQSVRGGGSGDVTETHLQWNLDNRSPSNLSSPLAVDGRVYVVKKGGLSSCFNADDGSTVWKLKRVHNFGEYYASPVYGDGKIYLTGENGLVAVLAAGPKLKFLAKKNDMGDSILATPSIADGKLFFRTRNGIVVVGNAE